MNTKLLDIISASKIESRPYQLRLAQDTIKLLTEQNAKSILIESPVGSGKTIIGLLIAKYLETHYDAKVGWVAMRRNLLSQAQEENEITGINAKIQTISMFDKFPPTELDTLVIDECQHDAAASMAHIHNTIKPRWIIGLSGTPFRSDCVKLCFEKVLKDFGIHRLIKDGYLAPYVHYTIPDWQVKTVIDTYVRDKERWGKSLIYFHTIEKCDEAVNMLRMNGIMCDVVTGNSNVDTQLELFKAGKLMVLVNCLKLTEGLNVPDIKTVFAKPSCKTTTIQMCGRVFRKFPGYQFKQIVQPKITKWPFLKTALPEEQFTWEHEEWRALQPNSKIRVAHQNTIKAISKIIVELPKLLTEKKSQRGRRRFRI